MDCFRESVFSEGLIEDFYGNFPRIHPPPTCYSAAGLLSHVLLSLSPCTCNVVFKQVNNWLFMFCFCFLWEFELASRVLIQFCELFWEDRMK